MLQLNYVVVSSKDLTSGERIYLACRGEEFGAILSNGFLKVNKDLKKPKKLEKLVRKMFEVDHLLSCEDDELWNALYDEICTTWGKVLWNQIRTAWGDTLDAKLKADADAAAATWLAHYGCIDYTDHIDDLIPDSCTGVIRSIFSKSQKIRDIFNYGFQMGAQYGAQEATA